MELGDNITFQASKCTFDHCDGNLDLEGYRNGQKEFSRANQRHLRNYHCPIPASTRGSGYTILFRRIESLEDGFMSIQNEKRICKVKDMRVGDYLCICDAHYTSKALILSHVTADQCIPLKNFIKSHADKGHAGMIVDKRWIKLTIEPSNKVSAPKEEEDIVDRIMEKLDDQKRELQQRDERRDEEQKQMIEDLKQFFVQQMQASRKNDKEHEERRNVRVGRLFNVLRQEYEDEIPSVQSHGRYDQAALDDLRQEFERKLAISIKEHESQRAILIQEHKDMIASLTQEYDLKLERVIQENKASFEEFQKDCVQKISSGTKADVTKSLYNISDQSGCHTNAKSEAAAGSPCQI
ncbi:hypothetical protein BGZ46_008234 [Entomortierella lignicola]|nr:hypothetical protein BGZ46_008234 [Entomortierella lignicola]